MPLSNVRFGMILFLNFFERTSFIIVNIFSLLASQLSFSVAIDKPMGSDNKVLYSNLYNVNLLFNFTLVVVIFPSIRRKYGRVLSLKVGSCKLVIAGTPEAVKEVLVTRSANYSGRPQLYYFITMTLGIMND